MPRRLFSFRGLILVFGLVAVGLPLALVWQLGIVRTLSSINNDIALTREGQLAAAAVLQHQLDEETAIRGYAATRRNVFLEPYQRGREVMPERFAQLQQLLAEIGTPENRRALADMRRVNAAWQRTVADPILLGKPGQNARLLHGKALIDRFRRDVGPIDQRFITLYHDRLAERERTIRTTTFVSIVAIALIGIEILVLALVVARMRFELDRERGFVETLQSAALVRLVAPPYLAIGTAYRSSTRGARIGGDVYDVYSIDADRTLLVIGDVSGKGLAAAVDTTFVRYALRALAGEGLPPDVVVTRFDALYRGANGTPESFVSLVASVYDRRDNSLTYTNAGHEGAWIRRGIDVERLPPTGPIVGVGGMPFASSRTTLKPGEVLVLATDGLTEARDPRGTVVPAERVTAWVAAAGSGTPQSQVDDLLAFVTRYTRGRIDDDLAILAAQPLP